MTEIETIKREIEAFLQELLGILEEEVTFEVEGDASDDLYINLSGSLFSLPEERSVLAALQHILRLYLRRKIGQECELIIDLNGAVKRKRAELIRFALATAESVCQEHKRVRLNPMPPHERRTIHMTLVNYPGVKTYSIGQGEGRRVVIEPDGT
jgi:spoIIIJ-associated protein